MNHIRISKYAPAFRVNGVYTAEEWTDYNDIGKTFDGQLLTTETYELVEHNYLEFFNTLVTQLNISELRLSSLELYDSTLSWQNGASLSLTQATDFLQACLRSKCWGRLEHPLLWAMVGYEFYLHIHCDLSYETVANIVPQFHLFAEDFGPGPACGRPLNASDRLPKEVRCYDFLDSLNISYQRIDHEAAMTMEACAEIDAVLDAGMCKNLLLCNRQRTAFYLLMIPGDKVFKTSVLSKQIGSSRLSFADGVYMEQYLDITPGSLSVLGLMNDTEQKVDLLIDEELLREAYIGCHPCINTSSLRIATADLMEKVIPAMGHPPMIVSLPRE